MFDVDTEQKVCVSEPGDILNADDDRCEPGAQWPGNDIDLDLFTL